MNSTTSTSANTQDLSFIEHEWFLRRLEDVLNNQEEYLKLQESRKLLCQITVLCQIWGDPYMISRRLFISLFKC